MLIPSFLMTSYFFHISLRYSHTEISSLSPAATHYQEVSVSNIHTQFFGFTQNATTGKMFPAF